MVSAPFRAAAQAEFEALDRGAGRVELEHLHRRVESLGMDAVRAEQVERRNREWPVCPMCHGAGRVKKGGV